MSDSMPDAQTDSLSFDRVADRYDATRGHPPASARAIAEGLMRVGGLQAGDHALEIGVGTGRIALPLISLGLNLTGVDISPRMMAQLEATRQALVGEASDAPWGALTLAVADMTALPFPNHSFDAVIAVHVLHLVPGWRQALTEALRVLKPGAALLLGQDVSQPDAMNHRIQDHWAEIVRELGGQTARVGAGSMREITSELRARGLTPTETIVASWEKSHTPRDVIAYVAERTWSQTWSIPDDLFAESVERLRAWVEEEYQGRLDTAIPTAYSFKVAVVRA